LRVLFAAVLLGIALPASADGPHPAERGPVLSLRAGYGVPSGAVARGGPGVADFAERKYPVGLELGYRLTRHLWPVLVVELAPATPASALCGGGASCSASDVHLGLQLVFRLLPGALVDPWVAAGAGVEVLNAAGRDTSGLGTARWSWAGVELPYLEAGLDLAVSSWIAVGPWASLSFTRFTSDSVTVEGADEVSGAVHGRTVHRWISGGLRATLRL
jgi:hypothetical protein